MFVAQLLFDDASDQARRLAALDAAALGRGHSLATYFTDGSTIRLEDSDDRLSPRGWADHLASSGVEIVHIHASTIDDRIVRPLRIPWVTAAPVRSRFSFLRKPATPTVDLRSRALPPAVDPSFFGVGHAPALSASAWWVASRGRSDEMTRFRERVLGRIRRFRDDVHWTIVDGAPSPHDFARHDLWIELANAPESHVAEAMAAGTIVVAERDAPGVQLLEEGTAGFVVPRDDPNEITHAILNALFKPELASPRLALACRAAARFRAEARTEALVAIYREALDGR